MYAELDNEALSKLGITNVFDYVLYVDVKINELVYEVGHIADCFAKGLLESPVVTGEFSARAIRTLEEIKAKWN